MDHISDWCAAFFFSKKVLVSEISFCRYFGSGERIVSMAIPSGAYGVPAVSWWRAKEQREEALSAPKVRDECCAASARVLRRAD